MQPFENISDSALLQLSLVCGFAAVLGLGKADLIPDFMVLPAAFMLVGLAQTLDGPFGRACRSGQADH